MYIVYMTLLISHLIPLPPPPPSIHLPPPPYQDPDENSIYYHPVYFTFNDDKQKPVAVRALYDYTQRRADELSFGKGAIITGVDKHEGGWWRGNYGHKKKKWFPANYVEEIDTADPQTEAEKQLGNLQQGAIDIAGEGGMEIHLKDCAFYCVLGERMTLSLSLSLSLSVPLSLSLLRLLH